VKPSARGFVLGALALTLVSVGLRLAIGSREWFYGDDFFFLTWIRNTDWSWREAFVPSGARWISAYRPLGLDAYFVANFAAFGFNAFGYYITGLVLQALTGFGVARIASHYGLERRIALASGLFVLIAGPSSTATYEIADHNYICAALATTLALGWFLDYLRSGRGRERWASCAMLAIGVLCNEISACMPLTAFLAALFASSGPLLERARKSVAALWPHLVVVVLFLDFRLSGVPRFAAATSGHLGWFYDIDVSLDMVGNSRGNLEYVVGGKLGLVAVVLLLAAVVWSRFASHRRGVSFDAGSQLVQLALISAVWLGTALLPFAVLALPATRFALALLPPAALLLGAGCQALLPVLRPVLRTPALLLGLALLTPWRDLREHLHQSRGAVYRDAHALAVQALRANATSHCVTVVCNGPGLANASQCALFREGAFTSELWRSVDPQRLLAVDYSEGGSEAFLERARNAENCVRFYLKRDLTMSTEPPRGTLESTLLSAR
jgi:hypothetical protein